MDNSWGHLFSNLEKLQNDTESLQALRKDYELRLKTLKIDLTRLPESLQSMLDFSVKMLLATNLKSLDESYILELIHKKRMQQIEDNFAETLIENRISAVEKEIQDEIDEIAFLTEFKERIAERTSDKADIKEQIAVMECKIKDYKKTQSDLVYKGEFDPHQLINDIEKIPPKKQYKSSRRKLNR